VQIAKLTRQPDKEKEYEGMLATTEDISIPVDEIENNPHEARAIYEAAHGNKHAIRHENQDDDDPTVSFHNTSSMLHSFKQRRGGNPRTHAAP
jgi:hypothetical protein